MDVNGIREDLKRFHDSVAGVLKEKGIRLEIILNERDYGNRVILIWWVKCEGEEEEMLHQSIFRIKEGVSWNMVFFLRKLMNEQSFITSCGNLVPKEGVKEIDAEKNISDNCKRLRGCETCAGDEESIGVERKRERNETD